MSYINLLSIDKEFFVQYGAAFDGITKDIAKKLAEVIIETKGKSLKQILKSAGVSNKYHNSLSNVFYVSKECGCFKKLSINDIDPFEIGSTLSAFKGISKALGEKFETTLSTSPFIDDEKIFWKLLKTNKVSKQNLTNLMPWITCGTNRGKSFRLDRFMKFDDDEIIITSVYPNTLKVGAKLTIKGKGFGPYREWINVKVGGELAEIVSYNERRGEIKLTVPQSAKDDAFIELDVNGIPNIQPFYINIKPSIVTTNCPDFAASKIEVLGTTFPCLVDVSRKSEIMPNETFTLKTSYYCGTNYCILPLGGAEGKFFNDAISFNSVINPTLYGLPKLTILPSTFFAFNYVPLVAEEEKDPRTGKVTVVYYFFRDGKWWRILDKNKKHPKDNKGIDITKGTNPNFTEAGPDKTAKFNKQFFPTGWQKTWEGFDEKTAIELQMMAGMLLALQGISEEDAKLIMQIKQMRNAGRSWDDILDKKWWAILKILLFAAATAGAGKLLGKFFGKLFKSRILKKLTKVDELEDEIVITIKKKFQPNSIKKGIQGEIKGKVNKGKGVLDCDPVAVDWINKTGKKGLATDLFEDWIKKLVDFARKKGLKKVRIRRAATSKAGEKMLERLGFKKIFTGESGSVWEKVIPVLH